MRVRPVVVLGAHGAPFGADDIGSRSPGVLACIAFPTTKAASIELEAIIADTVPVERDNFTRRAAVAAAPPHVPQQSRVLGLSG
eukprot:2951451-Prymnesium_polylepis.1